MGRNQYGQLGDGTTEGMHHWVVNDGVITVAAGSGHLVPEGGRFALGHGTESSWPTGDGTMQPHSPEGGGRWRTQWPPATVPADESILDGKGMVLSGRSVATNTAACDGTFETVPLTKRTRGPRLIL